MLPLIEHLIVIGQTWTGATVTLLGIVVLLGLRRLLPAEQRGRGTRSLWFLGLAFGLALSATAALRLDAYTVWGILSFLDLLSLVCGFTGLAGLIVFDFLFNRLHIRVPVILRDLIHPNEVKRILLDAVPGTPGVRAESAPDCVLLDFADSAITYALRSWISDFAHHAAIKSEVCMRIRSAARRGGLEILFPIRTILMPTLAPESKVRTISHDASVGGHSLFNALRRHWPEYVMEGAELGLYMLSACAFVVLLEYPTSPVHQALPDPALRRVLLGIAMGVTAIGIIYSPLGQRSGAHFNPAVTLTFFRLGKVEVWDAVFYSTAQFIGGLLGVVLSVLGLGELVAHPAVRYAVTVPGMSGVGVAFVAEVVISFLQMSLVLRLSNTPRQARFTGLCAGAMVATYISLEAPYSGMSMNPARTFASALPAQIWTALWIYFTAPPLGMLSAAELYVRQYGLHHVFCAKLHHHNNHRCIFHCNWKSL